MAKAAKAPKRMLVVAQCNNTVIFVVYKCGLEKTSEPFSREQEL